MDRRASPPRPIGCSSGSSSGSRRHATKPSTRPTSRPKAIAYIAEAGLHSLATEQFLGRLVKKAKGLVKGAVNLAKKGMKAVGKLLPIGKVFDALRKLVQPLLKKVLKMAIGKLPVAVQPAAKTLAAKLLRQGGRGALHR